MATKVTLETLAAQLAKMDDQIERMDARIERGFENTNTKFAALADDIGDIKHETRGKATKEQIVSLHGQVNAIETQLRGMQHTKLHARVADVEEKVFGRARD
jgi:prefoldin subunit 5